MATKTRELVGGKRKLDLIAVYVSKEKKQALEAWAESEERSLSWIVSKLIDKALQEREAENGSGSN
ncbi:CopG family transcriptional regulator [Microcoleus sp. LAD1_D1]|uniref:ribbon-helix-helix domain-containing protein n=1 Tax=Microcoleus sp. LAD1_D1 TaxID=2818812 RepID=UPI002FD3B414